MGVHRQHTFDLQPNQAAHEPGANRRGAVFAIGAASLAIVASAIAFPDEQATVTPIAAPQISTTTLPTAAAMQQRELHERLSDWRAGYEAAVQNGCQVRPLLGSPIGTQP